MLVPSGNEDDAPLIIAPLDAAREYRPSYFIKAVAFTGAVMAMLAAIAVPYLVSRSVYYLVTRKENFTFHEMIHTSSVLFWCFGPISALLATIAIVPFNIYNTYKTIMDSIGKPGCWNIKNFLKGLIGLVFLTSGSVNGYNTSAAYLDVIGTPSSGFGKAIYFLIVAIATIFAGLSDARIVINAFINEFVRDWRYVRRASVFALTKVGVYRCCRQAEADRDEMLYAIRSAIDDYEVKCQLALTDTQVMQCWNSINIPDDYFANIRIEDFIKIHEIKFPMVRYIISDWVGLFCAGILAYFGNLNVINYAFLAINGFFQYFGVSTASSFMFYLMMSFATIGYLVGFTLSVVLIRDLFIRDICKSSTWNDFKKRVAMITIPLIPAFCFGLLNVILTVTNQTLSAVVKIFVSVSALIGATVISRYGIEGNLEEFVGKVNHRRQLIAVGERLMTTCYRMNDEELEELHNMLYPTDNPVPDGIELATL